MSARQVIPVGIAGIGFSVPDRVVDNEYFTRFVETSDEWISTRTGIKQRRWLAEDEKPSDLFARAGRAALEDSLFGKLDPEAITGAVTSSAKTTRMNSSCTTKA